MKVSWRWQGAEFGVEDGNDLVDIVNQRLRKASVLAAGRVPLEQLHPAVGEPTIAVSIVDRLLSYGYCMQLSGGSMRPTLPPLEEAVARAEEISRTHTRSSRSGDVAPSVVPPSPPGGWHVHNACGHEINGVSIRPHREAADSITCMSDGLSPDCALRNRLSAHSSTQKETSIPGPKDPNKTARSQTRKRKRTGGDRAADQDVGTQ